MLLGLSSRWLWSLGALFTPEHLRLCETEKCQHQPCCQRHCVAVGTSDHALSLPILQLCSFKALVWAYLPVYCCLGIITDSVVRRRYGAGAGGRFSGDLRFLLSALQTNCTTPHLSILDSEALAVLPVPHQCSGRFRIHCQILHSCKRNVILGLSAWGEWRGREGWLTCSLTQCSPCSGRDLPWCRTFIPESKCAI